MFCMVKWNQDCCNFNIFTNQFTRHYFAELNTTRPSNMKNGTYNTSAGCTAAHRLHSGLREAGIDSKMLLLVNTHLVSMCEAGPRGGMMDEQMRHGSAKLCRFKP